MKKIESFPLTINKKINIIFIIFLLLLTGIMIRLFYLQMYLSHHLYTLSQKNYTRISFTSSARGNIIDTNGTLLATNRPIINLLWQGTGNKKLTHDQLQTIEQLKKILPTLIDDIIHDITLAEKQRKTATIATDISFEELSKVAEQFAKNPNITITTHCKRFYPYNNVASHILGYLSQVSVETIGKMGLEQLCEDDLKGQTGTIINTINSFGQKVDQKEIKRAIAGKTIKTTIDINIQLLAEQAFLDEYDGSMILMDPQTGALKALVSRPNFDPNIFLGKLTPTQWRELQEHKPFLNRAFNVCYPPASIFKLITLPAALEQGIVDQQTKTLCRGYTTFAGRPYHCKRHQGHGLLTIKESLAQSCNILFFEIGKRISINNLAEYARRFGLGQKTGVIFSEKEGLIPTTTWKMQTKGEPWWPGETLSAVIGQSFILVTPIQIACMISGIFQGFLVKPRMIL